eukprot:1157503-Pelagomonas_calceolata.AAC.5
MLPHRPDPPAPALQARSWELPEMLPHRQRPPSLRWKNITGKRHTETEEQCPVHAQVSIQPACTVGAHHAMNLQMLWTHN